MAAEPSGQESPPRGGQARRFVLAAVPLSRRPVADVITARARPARGATVAVVGQRPTAAAERAWLTRLQGVLDGGSVGVGDLLALDDPHAHLTDVATDRLVPTEALDDPAFLTRNLGGWAPVYLGALGLPSGPSPPDPVLEHLEVLVDYGDRIRAVTADPAQVAGRLERETGGDAAAAARAFTAVRRVREEAGRADRAVAALCRVLADGDGLPRSVVLDAMIQVLVDAEQTRRRAVADGDHRAAEEVAAAQARWADDLGLRLILKGEYIAGRHRRSTVLLARSLGVVVKQPAPEPLHEIELAQRTVDGRGENWPVPVDGGALVTPRGRLRMMVDDGAVEELTTAFDHPTELVTLVGLTIEPFIGGDTLQQAARARPAVLTHAAYEQILVCQQVCELLGVDNADWHAANFMRGPDGTLTHIDWGAARRLRSDEHEPAAAQRRIAQVRNLAFSFHDERLARRVDQLHEDLTGDPSAMRRVRQRAAAQLEGRPA